MDIIHTITKKLSHDRYTAIGASILAAAMTLGGCKLYDGKTVSSQSGEVVDREQLESEYVQGSNDLQKRWDAADALEQEAVAAKRKIAKEAEQLDAGFVADSEAIDAEIAARSGLVGQIGTLATDAANSSGVPWLGTLLGFGLTAVAGGAVVDNRRKDRIIKDKSKQ